MTYNQVQSFQVNDYVNHNVDIEITGYRELCSINCKQQCLHVYNICVRVLLIYQQFMLVITQLSHFSEHVASSHIEGRYLIPLVDMFAILLTRS